MRDSPALRVAMYTLVEVAQGSELAEKSHSALANAAVTLSAPETASTITTVQVLEEEQHVVDSMRSNPELKRRIEAVAEVG